MDVWHLISRDHANIADLIREIPLALNGRGVVRSRERLLADLLDELHAHGAAVEAGLLTPLAEADGRARDLVGSLRDEHAAALRQVEALSRHRVAGWLDAFEDATFRLDQHLHRHGHEMVPLARARFSPQQEQAAASAYIRARMQALRDRRHALPGVGGEILLGASVAAAAIGLGLLAWRSGLLRGAGASRSRTGGAASSGPGRGRPRAGLAAAAPSSRRPDEDPARRRDALLDEATEETFPASDPIAPHQITH
ncbi:hemerythrin domain-containing protein [Methylobacterium oryzihabitans]|uniref:Hemerythrin domain-containing protein n=1 Tax=Methylobacterium oryzihabitans TaxID=2499852 RepID=A0A437PD43_9HYPH|nr:hemerythrin domain-containing protein [Methylobacterium oryzihabitans]RVU20159.1 hemerythrin domain-containing protein [Methylobacterium oryzihabitans]